MQSNVNFVTDGSKVYHLGGNDWYAVTQDKDKVMLVDTDCNVNGNKFEQKIRYAIPFLYEVGRG